MKGTAYRLFGILVWRALRWYLRELMPSRRRILAAAGAAFAGALAVARGGAATGRVALRLAVRDQA